MPPAQALRTLLAGTGINVRLIGPTTATLVLPATSAAGPSPNGAIELDTINVLGTNPNSTMTLPPPYAGGQVATGGQLGLLGNRSVMDTPFNQISYTSQTIQDQQARTLVDVLNNDPSVRHATSAGGGTDPFVVRGFSVTNGDISMNGLYGIAPPISVSTSFLERVEVLKGPSALLNGMPPGGSIGGSINVLTKRAGEEPLTQVTTSYVSRGQLGAHVDIARRFGQDNACGARFNGSYAAGETSIINNKDRPGVAALGLDCHTDRFRVSADVGYQQRRTDGVTRFSYVTAEAVPAAPRAGRLFTPPWWYLETKDLFGMISGEFDIAPNITAYASAGAHNFDYDQLYGTPTIERTNGNYIAQPNRGVGYNKSAAAQAGIRASATTWIVDHALDFNASTLHQIAGAGDNPGSKIKSNIYNPGYFPPESISARAAAKYGDTKLTSIGVADTLSLFDKRIQFMVGVRRQEIDIVNFGQGYSKGAWSPAFGLVLRPWENVSLYANYIQGLQQGMTVGDEYANKDQVLPPFVSKQVEAGVKVDWGRLTTTISAFQIAQPNAVSVPGSPLPTLAVNGENRNRGVEINAFGQVTEDIRLLGGVMFLDARQLRTGSAINEGKNSIGAPDVQVNLGGEWNTPFERRLTLTGRMIYTSSQFVSADNKLSVPAWTRFDLGARYTWDGPWNKPVTIRFDVQNVFDRSYWGSVFFGYIGLGAPRTFLLSTTFNF